MRHQQKRIKMKIPDKALPIAFVVILLLGFYFKIHESEKKAVSQPQPESSADTFIPKGYVLVPIELANASALEALIDRFGLIDLYSEDEGRNKILLAAQIKILRAPLNPQQFAVLATEEKAKFIMQQKGSFWAVIQNKLNLPADQTAPENKVTLPVITSEIKTTKVINKNLEKMEIEYYKGGAK